MVIRLSQFSADGFHLIDLMVASSIAFLLVLTSLTVLTELNETWAVKKEVRKLELMFRELQMTALEHERKVVLHIEANRYFATVTDLDPKVQYSHTVSSSMVKLDSNQQLVQFYPSGVVSPVSITVASDKYSCKLIVSLRGRVRKRC